MFKLMPLSLSPARISLLLFTILLVQQIPSSSAQYGQVNTYCANYVPAADYACSNYRNNGGIDTNRCLGGWCEQCMDGGICSDTGYAPRCDHPLGPNCYMTNAINGRSLWNYGAGDYNYQYWHCNSICADLRPCDSCWAGFSFRVGCGGNSEGWCQDCRVCAPGTRVGVPCYSGYGYDWDSTCDPCDAGDFSLLDNSYWCEYCPAGTYSAAGASSCTPCPAGYYSAYQRMGYCDTCGAGTYSLAGASECTACPDGYYQPNPGSDACIQCSVCSAGTSPAPGGCTGSSDTFCVTVGCAAGEYSSGGACISCAAGTYSLAGSTYCIPCQSGSYSGSAMSFCSECSAGTYSLEGASSCTSCASGSYSLAGAGSCIQCGQCLAGYYRSGCGGGSGGLCLGCTNLS
jgi:hypothetical protein